MGKESLKGNLCATYSALIWGTTFIVTKNLMNSFNAVEILFARFFVALICVWFVGFVTKQNIFVKPNKAKDELLFVVTGFSGLFLYGVLEIFSMEYTFTANTSTIVSTNPFFIALFSVLILKEKRPSIWFFIGFVIAIAGIGVISFNGRSSFGLKPAGDILALGSAICWGVYTTFVKMADNKGYSTVFITGRTYLWGCIFMIISMPFFGFNGDFSRFVNTADLLRIVYLGVFASGSCFLSWNYANKLIGPINAALYIYSIPVVTVVFSVIFLQERLNILSVVGIGLVILGTLVSSKK